MLDTHMKENGVKIIDLIAEDADKADKALSFIYLFFNLIYFPVLEEIDKIVKKVLDLKLN